MVKESCCIKFLFGVLGGLVLLLMPLVAPLYRMYDGWTFNWFQGRHVSNWQAHRAKVERVSRQVKKWHAAGRKKRMCTAKPFWNSISVHGINKRELAQIDVSELTCVVEIDEANRMLTVEPGLMMGQLTSILNPRGWTIGVIPELEVLTVGGTVCGFGIESGSCRYGYSSDICVEYEVVLSNGDVVTCSENEHSDLFYSIPWSHGTLGFVTAIKIPLLPAKKWVRLEYHACTSLQEAKALLESQEHDFVEGIAYGRNEIVVTHGDMANRPPGGRVNHINHWYKPYFYQHAQSFLRPPRRQRAHKNVEYIPLRDYYHRHTRGGFWGWAAGFPLAGSRAFQFLFGWALPRNLKGLQRLVVPPLHSFIQRFIELALINAMFQDFVFPIRHLEEALSFTHDKTEVYPLWLNPCKLFKKPGMATHSSAGPEPELGIDLGVYGLASARKKAEYHYERTTHEFELFFLDRSGVQATYADMFLSRDEFCRMFDMTLYDKVRAKYDAQDAFPHVYDKVGKVARRIENLVPA